MKILNIILIASSLLILKCSSNPSSPSTSPEVVTREIKNVKLDKSVIYVGQPVNISWESTDPKSLNINISIIRYDSNKTDTIIVGSNIKDTDSYIWSLKRELLPGTYNLELHDSVSDTTINIVNFHATQDTTARIRLEVSGDFEHNSMPNKVKHFVSISGSPTFICYTAYSYNENGLLTNRSVYYPDWQDTNKFILSTGTKYSYYGDSMITVITEGNEDPQGNLQKLESGVRTINGDTVIFNDTLNGNMYERILNFWLNDSIQVDSTITSEAGQTKKNIYKRVFNKNGLLVGESVENDTGYKSSYAYSYEFDNYQRIVKIIKNTNSEMSYKTLEYNQKGLLSKVSYYGTDDNITGYDEYLYNSDL